MSSVKDQVSEILDDELRRLQDATKEAAREAAEKTVDQLKATSPKKARRGGKYARAWAYKRIGNGLLTTYVVYNSRYPGLTMNLEFGHAVSNQYGSTGKRAAAIPHIAPAEQMGIAEFEAAIERKMSRG